MTKLNIFEIIFLSKIDLYQEIIEDIDLDQVDSEKRSLLHVAITARNQMIVCDLIERGINMNKQDAKGNTGLHYALEYNMFEICELILDNGGEISIENIYGNTPLWTAVFNARGDYTGVRILLEKGARIFVKNKNTHGKSPLDFATQIGDQYLVNMLSGDDQPA